MRISRMICHITGTDGSYKQDDNDSVGKYCVLSDIMSDAEIYEKGVKLVRDTLTEYRKMARVKAERAARMDRDQVKLFG